MLDFWLPIIGPMCFLQFSKNFKGILTYRSRPFELLLAGMTGAYTKTCSRSRGSMLPKDVTTLDKQQHTVKYGGCGTSCLDYVTPTEACLFTRFW